MKNVVVSSVVSVATSEHPRVFHMELRLGRVLKKHFCLFCQFLRELPDLILSKKNCGCLLQATDRTDDFEP
jgi:hypothetical protein